MSPLLSIRMARVAAFAGAAIGGLALLGWWLHIPWLTTFGGSITSIKANAAMGLTLLGLAIFLSSTPKSRAKSDWARWLASLVLMMAVLTAIEIGSGRDLGIDQLLAQELEGASRGGAPGRMSPNVAVMLILMALGVLTVNLESRWALIVSQVSADLVIVISGMGTLGYFYGAHDFYAWPSFTPLAQMTSLACTLLGMALLLLRPDRGVGRVLTGDGPGSLSARQLLLPAICVPVLFGWAALSGSQKGIYGDNYAIALLVICNILFLTFLIFRSACSLNKVHRLRMAEVESRQQIEQMCKFRSRFLAGISHELRTPLTALLGFADLLDDVRQGPLTGLQHVYVKGIQANADHMLVITNDILDLSRIEADRLQLDVCLTDLVALVQQVIDDTLPLWKKGNLTLSLRAPQARVTVAVDPLRIRQVLLNLLDNAIKFSPDGEPVTVSIDETPGQVSVSVVDQGPGILPEELPMLFQEYVQLDNTRKRNHQGSGLGLTVAKRLVELHGGSIWFRNEPGGGAAFGFALPRAEA